MIIILYTNSTGLRLRKYMVQELSPFNKKEFKSRFKFKFIPKLELFIDHMVIEGLV